MINLPEEKLLYADIQKKLFYIIPEKWEKIYLYASVINVPNQKSVGEMYFYYLPKGIIKKKFVNGYEIPSIFNIDDEQYSKLISDVYNSIKLLHERFINTKRRVWSSINISIENFKFKVEFNYEDLTESPFDSYERHVIWRYNNLQEGVELLGRKDKKIIQAYEEYQSYQVPEKKDVYEEAIYKQPVKNIIDFEKTLTVEEAIAQSKTPDSQTPKEKKKNGLFKKKNKIEDIIIDDEEEIGYTNQILKMKK
jgi:hypothetical protein